MLVSVATVFILSLVNSKPGGKSSHKRQCDFINYSVQRANFTHVSGSLLESSVMDTRSQEEGEKSALSYIFAMITAVSVQFDSILLNSPID